MGDAPLQRPGTLGYLSGALRVSTRRTASASGPRSHVLGVIHALERTGWRVRPFILGDQLPSTLFRGGDRAAGDPGRFTSVAADMARLATGRISPGVAVRRLGTDLDLVYERFAAMQALGRPFQRRGVPWVLETNGPFFYEARVERESMAFSGLARQLELAAYRDCDVLVCVSGSLKEILLEETGVPAEKILVIPNAVDPSRFAPRGSEPARPSEPLTVGFVGTVLRWQGLDHLIRALAEVRRAGTDVKVVIVGDGPALPELRALAEHLGVGREVHFTGQVPWDDVPAHMAGFDVGYSGQVTMELGRMYHSPLKLYEYMAMGLPVLAAAHEDAIGLAGAGDRGFLFEPGNHLELASRLRDVVEARERLPSMGTSARNLILTHHTWEIRVGELLEGVERVLGMRLPSRRRPAE